MQIYYSIDIQYFVSGHNYVWTNINSEKKTENI